MASMTRLRRRLLRWERYAARYRRPGMGDVAGTGRGGARIWKAIQREEERRFWDETPEIWLGGPKGEAALVADVLGNDEGGDHA